MKNGIEHKVLAGFIGTFILLFFTGWILYKNDKDVSVSASWLSHTNEVLYRTASLNIMVADFESGAKGAVLSGDKSYAGQSEAKARQIGQSLGELEACVADNPVQRKNTRMLQSLVHQKIGSASSGLHALSAGSIEHARSAVASKKGDVLMKAISTSLSGIRNEEKRLFVERECAYERNLWYTRSLFIGLFVMIMLILGAVYLLLRKNIALRAKDETNTQSFNKMLENNIARLEAANKDLESFSYSVSHDLRSPLRAINGYMHVLSEDYAGQFDEDGKRMLAIVMNNTDKMGRLIDDLLAFSRIGRQELVKHTVEMSRLVSEVAEELKRDDPSAKVRLLIGDLPAANGDPGMLRQAWINLISNAIKYSKGKENPEIRITAYREKDKDVYCIADNGVGFDMSFYNKLFGVFQRLHNTDEFDGTGVGLAIVKRIVNKHKGEIWAESKINDGARFCFSIPNH